MLSWKYTYVAGGMKRSIERIARLFGVTVCDYRDAPVDAPKDSSPKLAPKSPT